MRSRLLPGRPAHSFPHLPPGREPGPQTLRNRAGYPFWEWAAGLVGAGLVVGGVFIAAGGRGPEFDRREEFWGGIFMASIGLVCAGWALFMRHKRRPLRLPNRLRGINLAVDREEARRGDELAVTLTFAGRARAEDERLEVGLVCIERHDYLVRAQHRAGATELRQTAEDTAHEQWQAIETASGEQTLTFEIPRDAPYSYEGDCVSYAWRVSARIPRKLRLDRRTDRPIWVRA